MKGSDAGNLPVGVWTNVVIPSGEVVMVYSDILGNGWGVREAGGGGTWPQATVPPRVRAIVNDAAIPAIAL